MRCKCITQECDHHDVVRGCKAIGGEFTFACEYGRFEWIIRSKMGDLGDWMIRARDQYNDTLIATLKGKSGRVEVWAGNATKLDVWCVPTGTRASDIERMKQFTPKGWDDLRGCVLKACALAGIQEVLPI